jgi:hypothetical protein
MVGKPKGQAEESNDAWRPPAMPRWLAPPIYVFVGVATVALLVAHTFSGKERPTVDTTSLGLLALLLILPLAPYITKLRAAGVEAEIGRQELRDLRKLASDLPGAPESAEASYAEEFEVIELTKRDPQLGLAKLRMDIESEVRRIYEERMPKPTRPFMTLGPMARDLVQQDALPREIAAPLQDVSALANRAIHGEYVSQDSAEEIAQIGVRVLEALRGLESDRPEGS